MTTYSSTSGVGFTVTDPAGRITAYADYGNGLIDSITDFANRQTALSYDTADYPYAALTSVQLPDPGHGEVQPLFTFGYDPGTGVMTSYTDANANAAGGKGTQFVYRADDGSDGTLEKVVAADGSSVVYQAAMSPIFRGVAAGGWPGSSPSNAAPLVLTAAAVGVQTDQSGNPTIYTFDTFGDPTSVENALGYTTVYQRNANGQVTEMDQPDPATGQTFYGNTPIGPVTSYSYDAYGMLTGETDPDGREQDWLYETIATPGGPYDVPTQTGEGCGALQQWQTPPINQITTFKYNDGDTYTYSPELSVNFENEAVYSSSSGNSFSGSVSGGTVTWIYAYYVGGLLETTTVPAANDILQEPEGLLQLQLPVDTAFYSYYTSAGPDGNAGDLKSAMQLGNASTQYTYTPARTAGDYCPAGLVASVADPDGNTTAYGYYTTGNQAGLLSQVNLPYDTSVATTSPLYLPETSEYYHYNSDDNLTSYTDASGNTTDYSYDNLDREVNETDPADASGNSPQTNWTYDAMGNVTQESVLQALTDSGTNSIWETTNYTYNNAGELTQVSAPGPNSPLPSGEGQGEGGQGEGTPAVTTYTYTRTRQVYQVTDPNSGTTTYGYDAIGEQTSVSLPDPASGAAGGPTSYTAYDPLGRVTDQKTYPVPPAENPYQSYEETSYSYQFGQYGNPLSPPGMTVWTTLLGAGTTTDVYNADGQLLTETDPLGYTTTYTYDLLGRPAQVENLYGHWVGPTYDADGNVIGDTDLVNGYVTDYVYNAQGELVQTEQPNATPGTNYGKTIVDGSPVGPVTTYGYDADGNLASEKDPMGNVTAWTYDADGNQTAMKLPDPANGDQDANSPKTSYTYDLVGNLLTTTSPSPVTPGAYVTTVNAYDQQNNLVSSEDADGNVTSYSYDQLGQTTSLTDTDGNTTNWTYDHDGQQTSQSSTVALGYFQDGTVHTATATSYDFYDGYGNPLATIDADGRTINYTFDSLNRETYEYWYDASGNQTGSVSYGYDAKSELTSAANYGPGYSEVASYGFNYDEVGNVSDVTARLQGVQNGTLPIQLASDYDYNGDRTKLAVNIGGGMPTWDTNDANGDTAGDFSAFTSGTDDFVNNYGYDPMGNMTGIVQTTQTPPAGSYPTVNAVAPKTVAFAYDADNRLAGLNRYNNDGSELNASTLVAAATYGYDHDSDLTSLAYADGAGNTVAAYQWTYNTAGLVTHEYSRNDTSGTIGSSYTSWAETTYSYDPDGQMLGASYSSKFAGATTTDNSLSYDPNGNRTSRRGRLACGQLKLDQPPALRWQLLLSVRCRRQPHRPVRQHAGQGPRFLRHGHHRLHLGQPQPDDGHLQLRHVYGVPSVAEFGQLERRRNSGGGDVLRRLRPDGPAERRRHDGELRLRRRECRTGVELVGAGDGA